MFCCGYVRSTIGRISELYFVWGTVLVQTIITTTKVVVCTDPRRVITGFAPKGASKVWHRIALTGRR